MSTPALDQDPGLSLLTITTPESSSSQMRKLIRDIKTEIRELKDYSKLAEAERCSLKERSQMRKLIRDIKTEIRDLEDYSKLAEAERCSIRERSQIRGG